MRLDEIVLQTLAKEPSLRYQQVSEVKTDMQSIGGSVQVNQKAQKNQQPEKGSAVRCNTSG